MLVVRLTLDDANAEAAETWVDAMGVFRLLKEQESAIRNSILQHPSQNPPRTFHWVERRSAGVAGCVSPKVLEADKELYRP